MKLGPHDRGCYECNRVFYIHDEQLRKSSEGHFADCGEHQELNPGRDLREEAKAVVLKAVGDATRAKTVKAGLDVIYNDVDLWVGSTDNLSRRLGRRTPQRPQEIFEGVSDAFLELDPTTLPVRFVLALLTLTGQLREETAPGRTQFAAQAQAHYEKTRPKDVKGLLGGLV